MVPLAYLIDENLRGMLAVVVVRTATLHGVEVDVLQVGDRFAPTLGTSDPDLLRWAQINDRILVSNDPNSLPGHLRDHLIRHGSSPGVILIRPETAAELAEFLVVAAHASDPADWADIVTFIP